MTMSYTFKIRSGCSSVIALFIYLVTCLVEIIIYSQNRLLTGYEVKDWG